MTTKILERTQDNRERQQNLNIIKSILLKSNYPSKEIDSVLKQACKEFKSTKMHNDHEKKEPT